MALQRFVVVFAGLGVASLLLTSCDALTERGYEPKYVTRATDEECAMIVEVAKTMVGPDTRGLPMKPAHQIADGGEYKEACAWRRLGVSNPRDPKPGEQSFVIYKPVYQAGDHTAQVTVDIIGPHQKGAQQQITGYASCQLRQVGATWTVERCTRSAKRG